MAGKPLDKLAFNEKATEDASKKPENMNPEKVLEELKAFITETKILIEKVMKMRIQCKEVQMIMLRSFNPKCIKVLQISNELSRKNIKYVNNNKKNKTKRISINKK